MPASFTSVTPAEPAAVKPPSYAWGYSEESTLNFRHWFRNGELRWSDWLYLGTTNPPPDPYNDSWWNENCARAWTERPNWLYTGTYKLTNQEYTDPGNAAPTLTAPPNPKDVNHDGEIDRLDIQIIFSLYFQNNWPNQIYPDVLPDQKINSLDYVLVAGEL